MSESIRLLSRFAHAIDVKALFCVLTSMAILSWVATAQADSADPRLRFLDVNSTTDTFVYEFEGQGSDKLLEGVLVRPAGPGKHPAVVLNHGASNKPIGKALEIGPGLARRGYVTIVPRYSFALPKPGATPKASNRNPQADVLLCNGAADFAKSLPFVKGEKIGVTGISAGGFLILSTLMGSGVDKFASAAVVSAGLQSPDDPQIPLSRINVPVLVILGTDDEIIPPVFGANLETALQKAGKTSKLITYDKAPHDLFNWNRDRLADDLADWWDETLK